MSINLQLDAKILTTKVYFLKSKEKGIINQKFDNVHTQNRM